MRVDRDLELSLEHPNTRTQRNEEAPVKEPTEETSQERQSL